MRASTGTAEPRKSTANPPGRTSCARSTTVLASIRRRIGRGDLKPGDRVPSTRQITREWAFATKVLQALQQEGLVVARPGTMAASAGPAAAEVTRTHMIDAAFGDHPFHEPAAGRAGTAAARSAGS